MTKKELIEQLNQYEDDEEIWLHHKRKGDIMPEEITVPITKTEITASGVLLS